MSYMSATHTYSRLSRDERTSLLQVVAVFVLLLLGLVAYAVYTEVSSTNVLNGKIAELRVANQAAATEVAIDQREIASANSSAWITAQARQYGFVMPGEQLFHISANPPAATGGVDVPGLPVPGQSASAWTTWLRVTLHKKFPPVVP